MNVQINPCKIQGKIAAPASKSMLIRAIAATALSKGKSTIKNFTLCNDVQTAVNIAKLFGAEVETGNNQIHITGKNINKVSSFNCNESALCMHIFTPLAALFSDRFTILGEKTLLKRNIHSLQRMLNLSGLITNITEYLPFTVCKKLQSVNIEIDGSVGSQALSGLLMALPLCDKNSVVNVKNLKSKPYVDLTVNMLKLFRIKIQNENYSRFFIPGNQKYQATTVNIEGDWSGASCLFAAAAVNGEITVDNLNPQSLQADAAMLDVLQLCGASISTANGTVTVKKNQLKAFNFDATDCPDLFPAIAALAANCNGTSIIKGIMRLKNKESNRAETLQHEYAALNIKIELQNDEMHITGNKICSATVNSHNDHRIAMSLAAAAVNADGCIIVENAECVEKSYPCFWKDLISVSVSNK